MGEDAAARQLYDQLRLQGVPLVRQWLHDGTRESLILDFKRVPSDHKGIRELVSELVSAFANSAGGTIVWGVETGKGSDADRPIAISGVDDPDAFRAWLQSVVPNAVQPAARTETIVVPGDSLSPAVVVTFVPASDLPPHQAVLVKGKPYHMRLDAHNRPMEHHTIADMFGRRLRPVLEAFLDVQWLTGRDGSGPNLPTTTNWVRLGVRNVGRGTARYPYCRVQGTRGHHVSAWRSEPDGRVLATKDGVEWNPGAGRVLYPDTFTWVGSCQSQPTHAVEIWGEVMAEEFYRKSFHYRVHPNGAWE